MPQRERRYDRWALCPAMTTTCARSPTAVVFGSGSGGVDVVAIARGALVSGVGLELSLIAVSFKLTGGQSKI